MMQLILIGIAMVGADVRALMNAKTSAQIESIHHGILQDRILKERCDIEMKQSWIPVSCFEWVHQATLAKAAHNQLLVLFNRRCLSALKAKPPLPNKKIFKFIAPGPCHVEVQKYYLDHHYKTAVSSSLEEVMKKTDMVIQIGKEIVNEPGYESNKIRQNQQLHTRGATGGRLN
jgi:hypothetical protein